MFLSALVKKNCLKPVIICYNYIFFKETNQTNVIKKQFFTLINNLCTQEKNSCTLVSTSVHLEDHCFKLLTRAYS